MQQTQEQHEEEVQGGGVEQQSTRWLSMAGAAEEQEERHEGTRSGKETQGQERVTRKPRENKGHGHGKAREGKKKWQQQEACGER